MKQFLPIFFIASYLLVNIDCVAQKIDTAGIYKSKCAGCHGLEGDGQGPGASIVYPPPRDFRTWMFKYKSTPVDYAPTDEDMIRMLKKGLSGTSMPGFEEILSDGEIKALALYLQKFSFFEIEIADDSLIVKVNESPRKPDVEHGKKLYIKFECAKCHGEEGRGDGPSYPDLKDDWENQIYPRNLTKPWIYRRGSTMEDIYIVLKIGIPGTPMPSFIETLQQEEGMTNEKIEYDLWSLAQYVQSLQEEPYFGSTIKAKFTTTLTDDPNDETWEDVKAVRLPLIGQVIIPPRNFTPSVEDILLKVIHNGNEIAVLVQWDDPTETNDSLPDKMAIEFPVEYGGRKKPFFLFGEKDNPVNLWVFDNGEIYEATAEGAGTLLKQDNNDLSGTWKYQDGRYSVIFKRALNTGSENDIALEVKKFAPVAFFIWDGFNNESDLKCAVSSWNYLVPEGKPTLIKIILVPLLVILLVGFLQILLVKKMKNEKEV